MSAPTATAAPAPAENKKEAENKDAKQEAKFDDKKSAAAFRRSVDDLLVRRFFYAPAFEIYGGTGGLYDYGPPGCAVKEYLINYWRQHFVLTENMLEVSCTSLTPYQVLKTSGHVDKFTDFMVRDEKTQECYRADKLLEDHIDVLLEKEKDEKKRAELLSTRTQAGAMQQAALDKALKDLKVKSPEGNGVSSPFAFNLMFQTQIGPTGKLIGYLRPETAQGIFVNFRRLLEANNSRMPFAAAQIGHAFRNEIAPRAGLLRVREFQMAEIEHFVNPNDKRHPKFPKIANVAMSLLAREDQTGADIPRQMTAGEAVQRKIINNETLAYFMVRTHLFLLAVGIKPSKLRFRQHKSDEMAHYAADCWDAEVHTTYGWVEVVGHADRAAYDLRAHTAASKVELSAFETYAAPRDVEVAKLKLDKGKIGKALKKDGQILISHLENLAANDLPALKTIAQALEQKGEAAVVVKVGNENKELKLQKADAGITFAMEKKSGEKFIPSVIEPSFGLGRIMYAIFEHTYCQRDGDAARSYLALPAVIAPIKVAILPMNNDVKYEPFVDQLVNSLISLNVSTKVDNSGISPGRKYARADEIGTPYAITIDPDTCADQKVTIRERDSMNQVRVPVATAIQLCHQLVSGLTTWAHVYETNPKFFRPSDDE